MGVNWRSVLCEQGKSQPDGAVLTLEEDLLLPDRVLAAAGMSLARGLVRPSFVSTDFQPTSLLSGFRESVELTNIDREK
jgi:hypothetical protein